MKILIRHFNPHNAFIFEVGALGGFVFSTLIWLVVAVSTPAPMVMVDVARLGARKVHDRLPEEIRDRIPEELRLRISR